MSKNQRLQTHEEMMDLVECYCFMKHFTPEQRVEMTTNIAVLMIMMTDEHKTHLISALLAQMAALVLALADLRGESMEESVAHWRMSVMAGMLEHRADSV